MALDPQSKVNRVLSMETHGTLADLHIERCTPGQSFGTGFWE